MKNGTNNKRVDWIDTVRGLAILAILTSHSGFVFLPRLFHPLVSPVMILVFVYTGGWLYRKNKSPFTFLLSYLLIGLLSFVIWFFLRSYYPNHYLDYPVGKTLLDFLLGKDIVFNGPLWFLPAYAICLCLANFIYPHFRNYSKIGQFTLSLSIILSSLIINPQRIHYPYSIDLAVLFLGIFLFGNLCSRLPTYVWKNRRLGLIILVAYLLGIYLNGAVDIYLRLFGVVVLFVVNVISGLLLVTNLTMITGKKLKLIRVAGRNSLLLYSLHLPTMQLITTIISKTSILGYFGVNYTYISFWFPGQKSYELYFAIIIFFTIYVVFPTFFIVKIRGLKLWPRLFGRYRSLQASSFLSTTTTKKQQSKH